MQSEQTAAPRSSGSKLCSESNSHSPALTVGTQWDNEKRDPQLGTQFSMEVGDIEGSRFGTSEPGSRFAIVPWQPLIEGSRARTAQDVMKTVMLKDELEFYPGSPNQGGLSAA